MQAIARWIDSNPEKVEVHLPEGWSVDKVKRQALAISQMDRMTDGKISKCSPESITLAVLQAAALGLELGTGDAYLIPYSNSATLSVGYRGMIKLAKKSGEITHLKAEVVYEGEEFRVWSDSQGEHLQHVPSFPRSERAIIAAYVRINCHDGFVDYEYIDVAEIDRVKAASEAKMRGKTSPAWSQWFGEMAKKAVIRRALKRYTLSPEVERVFEHEDRVLYTNVEVVSAPNKTVALNRRLGLAGEPSEEDAPSQTPDDPPVSDSPPVGSGGSDGDLERHRKAVFAMLNRSAQDKKVVEDARRQFVWSTYEATSLADLGVEEFEDFRKTLSSLSAKVADGEEISELDDWVVSQAMEFDEDQWKAAKEPK